MFKVNIFGTKITEVIFKANTKYFRDGAFRMKLCLYMSPPCQFYNTGFTYIYSTEQLLQYCKTDTGNEGYASTFQGILLKVQFTTTGLILSCYLTQPLGG